MQQALKTIDDDFAATAVTRTAQQLSSPRLALLLRHWHEVRGRRLMPGWQDLDPSQLTPVLPEIWAWGYDRETDRFTGRLLGEKIHVLLGRSIANVSMEAYFEGWNHAEIVACRKRVVDEPAIALERGQIFRCDGQIGFGERLILPLAKDGRHTDMIVGASDYELRADFLAEATGPGGAEPGKSALGYLGGTVTQFFPL